MKRRGSPGKAGHGEIKTAPKEVDRTDFSNVSGTKMIKYAVDAHEGFEETFHGLGIGAGTIFRFPRPKRLETRLF